MIVPWPGMSLVSARATFMVASSASITRDGTSSSLEQLKEVFTNLQEQIGYETRKGDASAGWLRLGALVLALAGLSALLINRRLPN